MFFCGFKIKRRIAFVADFAYSALRRFYVIGHILCYVMLGLALVVVCLFFRDLSSVIEKICNFVGWKLRY